MRTTTAVIAVVGVASGISGLAFWSHGSSGNVAYRTVPVERDDLVISVSATGTTEPEEIVDIGAQVSGRIKCFGVDPEDPNETVDYGTRVEEGTVLAQIDEAPYQAAVDRAEAQLKRAQAELDRSKARAKQAEADWNRAQNLGESISKSEHDRYEAEYEAALAEVQIGLAGVEQAKAALHEAKVDLGYVTISSPIEGVVLDRRVNVGQTVVSGLNAPSLFLLAKDLKKLEVWASVNEADIGMISPGQTVTFTVDAYPRRKFRGTVEQIRLNASMMHNVVSYTVIVATDNRDRVLLPYMTASLQFEVQRRDDALLVPNQALLWSPLPEQIDPAVRKEALASARRREAAAADEDGHPGDSQGVLWVQAKNGKVRPMTVWTGLSDGIITELVDSDLKPGDRVIIGQVQNEENAGFTSTFVGIGK